MHRIFSSLNARSHRWLRIFAIGATLLWLNGTCDTAQAQDDGSRVATDGGGQEILESVFVPPIAHAPFSLTLATEWTRPLNNGGTYTLVNRRPIKRDSAGRIYQERWLLTPKGSEIPSRMNWIQIADPNAHTLYQCNAFQHVCELLTYSGSADIHYQPSLFKSGPLANGKGTRTHEDLGGSERAGVPVHGYRDTTTLNPGVMGNDLPMTTVREFYYSAELEINLSSVLDAPQVGRETFTAEELSTNDPDPSFFEPPQGYTVVDHRKATPTK
jgi:hypothetical protein